MSRRRNVTRDHNTPRLCGNCPRPTRDNAYLCDHCTDALLADLIDLADWLLRELDATCSGERAVSYSGSGGGGGAVGFLNVAAIAARDDIRRILNAMLIPVTDERRGMDLRGTADWLSDHTHWITLHPDGPKHAKALRDAVRRAVRLVDLPPDRQLLGRCPHCPNGRVYADPAHTYGRCDTCRTQHDADAMWDDTLTVLEDKLVTASEAAHLAMVMGIGGDRDKVRKRIGQWAVRGLVDSYENEAGATAFRFGDIWERLKPPTKEGTPT